MLRVLNSVKLDILAQRRQLDEVKCLEKDEEGLAAILRGIDLRLEVLESVWDDATSDTALDDLLASVFEEKSTSIAVASTHRDDESSSQGGNSQQVSNMTFSCILG